MILFFSIFLKKIKAKAFIFYKKSIENALAFETIFLNKTIFI